MSAPTLAPHRLWIAVRAVPLWAHAIGLFLLLLVLMPVVGTSASFSSDEGAYIHQARALSDRETWVIPHPLPDVDPDGSSFSIALAAPADGGFVAVSKHPAYTGLLALADGLGGVTAMVAVSALGTVGAAVAGALIARRLVSGLEVPTLWAIGVGSPLFFDSYLVLAHSVAAMLAGFLVLGVLAARERWRALPLVGAAACAVGVVTMRREGILLVAAVAIVVGVDGLRRRNPRTLLVAGSIGVVGVATALADRVLRPTVSGSAIEIVESATWTLSGRREAFVTTWLAPGYEPLEVSEALIIAVLVLGVVLVALTRFLETDQGLHVLVAAMVLAASIGLVLVVSDDPVPGLLAACPVVLYGLIALRRPRGETAVVLAIAAAFSVAVILTQYDRGGSLEWGGRYFAIGIPVLVAGLLVDLRALLGSLDRTSRRAVVSALVVSSVALAVSAVTTLRHAHEGVDDIVSSAVRLGDQVESGDGGEPVIVTTDPDLGRLAWPIADDSRLLYVEAADAPALVGRIEVVGIDHFVLATGEPGLAQTLEAEGLVTIVDQDLDSGVALSLLESVGRSTTR